jgi:hypothetical protein
MAFLEAVNLACDVRRDGELGRAVAKEAAGWTLDADDARALKRADVEAVANLRQRVANQ